MKVKIFLDKRRILQNGKYPVKFRLYDKGKTAYIPSEYVGDDSDFDIESGLFIITDKKTRTERMQSNVDLLNIKDDIEELYNNVSKKGNRQISVDKLKELYISGEYRNEITLNEYFNRFISAKAGRTAEIYKTTLSKIEKYFGKSVYFDDVNKQWLEELDAKLIVEPIKNRDGSIRKIGLEANARSIHFRNIRSVFNYAINNDIIPINIYPFRKFKIKSEPTIKRSVSIENLRLIFSYNEKDNLIWARDIAILIFGLIGINIKDLYNISDFSGKYISYKRAKTGRIYKIAIDPEIKKILEKYSNIEGFIIKEQMLLKSFTIKLNKHLKLICKDIGIQNITTYSLRHSWATIAAELEIPKETIGAALGHSDKSVTNIYINFNQKKIDDANKKVLDYIFQRGEYKVKKEAY